MASSTPGIALAIATADCGPVLFADAERRVIGACHAGWKGAFTGVVEATVSRMIELGAKRDAIVAVLGPCIGPKAYEVGPEFVARFDEQSPDNTRFFAPSAREGHAYFDLHGYIGERAKRAGIESFTDLGLCTYADEKRFYSYRRMGHRGESDYGRLISAIMLTE
jgi:YfiH family protein